MKVHGHRLIPYGHDVFYCHPIASPFPLPAASTAPISPPLKAGNDQRSSLLRTHRRIHSPFQTEIRPSGWHVPARISGLGRSRRRQAIQHATTRSRLDRVQVTMCRGGGVHAEQIPSGTGRHQPKSPGDDARQRRSSRCRQFGLRQCRHGQRWFGRCGGHEEGGRGVYSFGSRREKVGADSCHEYGRHWTTVSSRYSASRFHTVVLCR